jgi:geranylgeranyl diphosphate synthase type II
MHSPSQLLSAFEKELEQEKLFKEPQNLYDPVNYILSLGGKRIRPVMALMACEMFGGDIRQAMPAALGIEMFHNFSLVHDDIMDRAPLRRGSPTVHEEYDANAAILSGDTMLVLAYEYFLRLEPQLLKPVLAIFSRTAKEVCEGQQYDMNFESLMDVTIDDYLEMIRLKTAVLIGASYEIGSIVAGAGKDDLEKVYDFGVNAGIAFQLMDDLLDSYGDEQSFGKKQYGDIHTNKKTFLYLKALELAEPEDAGKLKWYYADNDYDAEEKAQQVISIFNRLNVKAHTGKMISYYHDIALESFDRISIPKTNKKIILQFTEKLMARKY